MSLPIAGWQLEQQLSKKPAEKIYFRISFKVESLRENTKEIKENVI